MKCPDMQRGMARWVASFLLTVVLSIVVISDLQAAPFAYIPNYNDGTVSVIDTATNTVTATVPAPGGNPGYLAVHPNGTRVYITYQHRWLRVMDTATNTIIATLDLGGPNITGVAVSPDGTRVYAVANHYVYGPGAIAIIDTATDAEIQPRVTVGGGPNGVAVSPDGTRVYVANQYSGTVSVIDTTTAPNAVIATVTVGLGSGWPVADAIGIAVSPDGTRAYVTNRDSDKVSVIDTASDTVTATVAVGDGPIGIAVSPDGTRAYVTNIWESTVSVIDTITNSVISTIPVGTWPDGVDVHPMGTFVYVANYSTDNVSVIDTSTNTVVGSVAVGDGPIALGKFITGTATFTITASAGPNGSIAPSGITTVNSGDSQTFTITPDPGFLVADVLVDGSSIGVVTGYTFSNVTANHTIDASFANIYDSLRALLNGDCITNKGILNSLIVKLNNAEAAEQRGDLTAKAGMVGAFINEVQAQTGKAIDPECAAELIRLAQLL